MHFSHFDIHSHLNLSPLNERVGELARELRSRAIGTITVGIDTATSREAIRLAHEYPDTLFATVGLHPTDVLQEEFSFEIFLELARDPKVVGIGECGLDYYRNRDESFIALQKKVFRAHIELALLVGKPLMLHIRPEAGTMTAYHDALDILEEYYKLHGSALRGNAHFFVGDIAVADRFLALGFTLSFDGPITFTNQYDEVIRHVPLDRIMCETDAPFAAPVPHRGQMNLPIYVPHIYSKIAELKGISEQELVAQIFRNIQKIWGIG